MRGITILKETAANMIEVFDRKLKVITQNNLYRLSVMLSGAKQCQQNAMPLTEACKMNVAYYAAS